jgi:hypothetical protein
MRIEKKGQPKSRPSRNQFRRFRPVALVTMFCISCGLAFAGTLRFYPPTKDEAGALLLTQIVNLATRAEILKLGDHTLQLLASGLKDPEWKDGSLAVGRINCCHQSTEAGSALWFYVPPDVPLELGDIVEVRLGRESTKTDPGAVNTAVRVREKQNAPDSQCLWDPPNDLMWARILYCKWMPAEGWTLKNGMHKTWLKRDPDAKNQ